MADPEIPHPRSHRQRSALSRIVSAERFRAADRRNRSLTWRIITPAAFAASGVLLVTSAVNSGGTDLRAGRYESLADLAMTETARVQALRADIAALNGEVETLTEGVSSSQLDDLNKQMAGVEVAAGVVAMEGPGVTVTLDDAPDEILNSAGEQVSEAIVHQQDIQAVANAMWAGGAEAITIQGQRIISTTGIKCIGNTVRLQDVPYSPPYVISAIGPTASMLDSIDSNPYIDRYLDAADIWQLGYEVSTERSIDAPAYTGPLEMRYARPAGKRDSGT